jgi:polysaccharide biosynthesis transport protein
VSSFSGGGPARFLRVYALWILLVTIVVLTGALGVSVVDTPKYTANAVVIVEPRVLPNRSPITPAMGTEKELASSGRVIDPTARALGIDPTDLVDGLSITVAPDADVLTFAYAHPEPRTAQRRAEAVAEMYVTYRNSIDTQAQQSPTAGEAERSALQATLVTSAALPSTPEGRTVWINLAVGLIVGLALGLGTALIRDRMSDRLRGRDDFERVSGVRVLATVPRVRAQRRHRADGPVILRAPDSPAAEAFRYLRSRLQAKTIRSGRAATILVTSAGDGEGRTTTAANLGAAMALSGLDVIVVDTDLRNPRIHAAFDRGNDIGLTSVLTEQTRALSALQNTAVTGLRVLTAGPPVANMGDLLEETRLRLLLDELRADCEFIILDSAPVLNVSDPVALASVSDHVLLVANQRRTTRRFVTTALRELGDLAGRDVFGVLVNVPRGADAHTPRGRGHAGPPVAGAAGSPVSGAAAHPPADRRPRLTPVK